MAGYLNTVGVGDCIVWLKQIPDNSVDSCASDAPYGLGKSPDPVAVLSAWCRGEVFDPQGAGFLGKKWDAFVPQPPVWREVFRVLKPGAFLVVFFGTRTYDWGVMAIRFAGFEVLDQIDWLYGTGMPKSGKFGAAEQDERWEGWDTTLKPGHEPIVVARKPFEGTLTNNVLENGTGALNIGACRVGGEGGRWPSNVLLTHSPDCVQTGTRRVKTGTAVRENLPDEGDSPGQVFSHRKSRGPNFSHADEDGTEEVEAWDCSPDCPVGALDAQSGQSTSASGEQRIVRQTASSALWHGMGQKGNEHVFQGYGDKGGASRFFWCAKAPNSERWSYCKKCDQVFTHHKDRFADHADHADQVVSHPTQKPLALMEFLVALVTQPGGVVLDPYCGTGTTALAAKRQGFNYITCDLSPAYARIAEARLGACDSVARDTLTSGAHFCPGCKEQGQVTLIDTDTIARARERGRKITCMVCMKRFPVETFGE